MDQPPNEAHSKDGFDICVTHEVAVPTAERPRPRTQQAEHILDRHNHHPLGGAMQLQEQLFPPALACVTNAFYLNAYKYETI
eukprot:1194281-Prorocentrum_minimum.AAC.6